MPVPPRQSGSLKGTREQIVRLLRRSPRTANEIAAHVGLTHNAVRSHLAALRRDGVVRQGSLQPSASRPAIRYELLPEAESAFSRAYIPFIAHLMQVLQQRLPEGELDDVMRTVGRRLGAEWPRLRGELPQRVAEASMLLEELGAMNDVEVLEGGFVLRGHGCVLSEAVHGRPQVCRAVESLLAELLEVSVRECCVREGRPRCCFVIADHGVSGAVPQVS